MIVISVLSNQQIIERDFFRHAGVGRHPAPPLLDSGSPPLAFAGVARNDE